MVSEVNDMRNRVLPILGALWPYGIAGFWLLANSPAAQFLQDLFYPMLAFLLLAPVLAICGLIQGLRDTEASPASLAGRSLAVKLAHIPFYGLVFFLFLILPLGFAFFFIFDVLTMVVSGGFGIAAIVRARRAGMLSNFQTALHLIAHCLFVADAISAFLLWRKLKKA